MITDDNGMIDGEALRKYIIEKNEDVFIDCDTMVLEHLHSIYGIQASSN